MDNYLLMRYDEVLSFFSEKIRFVLARIPAQLKEEIQEIHLRRQGALTVSTQSKNLFVMKSGRTSEVYPNDAVICSADELEQTFRAMCNYSVHTHQNEIKNGFISLQGGHRCGIAGTAVIEKGEVITLRDITSLCLRIARQVYGAADQIAPLFHKRVSGLLLAGPPASGKTTVLRDLARQLSSGIVGECQKVCVIDERGELAAVYQGMMQNDLGYHCDVLTGVPKAQGILMAVRCLSPQVILCDEIGGEGEAEAVTGALNAGVPVIASAHACSMEELIHRPPMQMLLNTGAFERVVFLDTGERRGNVKKICEVGKWYDQDHRGRLSSDHSVPDRLAFFTKSPAEGRGIGSGSTDAGYHGERDSIWKR